MMIRTLASTCRRALLLPRHQSLAITTANSNTSSPSPQQQQQQQHQHRFYAQEARSKAIVVRDYEDKFFKGDVVTVKAGYMRNELYPRKVCIYATKENMEQLEREMTDEKYMALEDKKRGARVTRFFRKESKGLEMKRTTLDEPVKQKGSSIYVDLVHMLDQPVTRREVFERILSAFPDVADTINLSSVEIPEDMVMDRTGTYNVPIRVSQTEVFEMPIHITRRIKTATRRTSPMSREEEDKMREEGKRSMTEEERKNMEDEMMSYMKMSDMELMSGMEEAKVDLEVMEKIKRGMSVDEIVDSMKKPRRKRQKQEERIERKQEKDLLKSADLKTE